MVGDRLYRMDQSAAASLSSADSMAQCERLLPLPAQHLSRAGGLLRAGGLCRSLVRCGATSSSTAAMEFAWRPPTAPERPWNAFPPTLWHSLGCSRRAPAATFPLPLPDARYARVLKLGQDRPGIHVARLLRCVPPLFPFPSLANDARTWRSGQD